MTSKETLERFIFSDEVQKAFEKLNSITLDYNILEITGMGTQEIKHSNILSWLFSDSHHELEYRVLEKFLINVSDYNNASDLKHYVYLSNKKNITVFREQFNIDLLLIDNANKVAIAFENKLYANERETGDDGGQLYKYSSYVEKKFADFRKFYIFLTIDGINPSENNEEWLIADYNMIAKSISECLNDKNIDTNIKTVLLLESYLDMLKRRGIVENNQISEICDKVWQNPEYRKALDILFEYKPDKIKQISDSIHNILASYPDLELDSCSKAIIRFRDRKFDNDHNMGSGWTTSKRVLLYEFYIADQFGVGLKLVVGPTNEDNTSFRQSILKYFNKEASTSKKFTTVWSNKPVTPDELENKSFYELEEKLHDYLTVFMKNDGEFFKNRAKYLQNN